MSKKDAALLQFESALRELKAGKEESAAAVSVGWGEKDVNPSKLLVKLIFKFWGRIMLMAALFGIAIIGSVWWFSGNTLKKESATFVEQVQELATLTTAQAHMKVIMEQEDNKLFGKDISLNLPGTKRELLLVVPATVTAGVDLKGITSDDIKVNDQEKEMEITVPHASFVQEPAIQMDKVRTFSDEGLFRNEVKWDEGFDLAAEAQVKVKEEAIEMGLLNRAEKNAEKVLKEFFRNFGYSVKLTFR